MFTVCFVVLGAQCLTICLRAQPCRHVLFEHGRGAGGETHLVGVVADHGGFPTGLDQGHGGEQAELAVAEHDGAVGRAGHVQYVQRGRERLGEHRCVIVHSVGHPIQAALGHSHLLGHGAGAAQDAQHGTVGAVVTVALAAIGTLATARIDVGDHPRAPPAGLVRFHYFADELVAEHIVKLHVARGQLQIRIAHAGQAHAHQGLAGLALWRRVIADQARFVVENEGLHVTACGCSRHHTGGRTGPGGTPRLFRDADLA